MGIPSPRLCIIHLFLCLYFVPITICQPNFGYFYYLCSNTVGNYTNSSIYKTNLNTFLASISSEPLNDSGFYNISVGQAPNTVNGIALCRGDATQQDCHQCLNDTAIKLPQYCPAQKEATWWYETCMLRYSNNTILGIWDYYTWGLPNGNNVNNEDEFNLVMVKLLSSLMYKAASGNSQLKFATGQDNLDDDGKLYALAQCTPDLSYQNCFYCIWNVINWLQYCCANRKGARVVGKSCNIRYEFYQFYSLSNTSSPPPLPILPAPIPAPPLLSNSTASGNIEIVHSALHKNNELQSCRYLFLFVLSNMCAVILMSDNRNILFEIFTWLCFLDLGNHT